MAIRTCLFDLGNVLVLFSHEVMCEQVSALVGRPLANVRSGLMDADLGRGFDCGRWTPEEFHELVMGRLGATSELADFNHAISAIFRLNEPMPAVLDAIRTAGVRLVLLSNTCAPHIEYIRENFDLLSRFDECVLSYEVGAVKPDAAIYAAAAEAIQCDPGECFFTDDIRENITAARSHGFDAHVFRGVERLRGQLVQRGVIGAAEA